jgi:pyruvate-ferredoxin/flavodoxin oxidoreductase
MHMSAVAHLSAIKGRVPFIHFFDGFRTSHEIQKVKLLDYKDLKEMLDAEALENFRKKSLNPEHPAMRGTAQNDDVFFQNREACNKYYDKIPQTVETYMNKINEKAKTNYKPFNYYGDANAEKIIVAMGSVCETIEEVIDYLAAKGEKVGLVKVRLYRPFSAEHLINVIPKSVKKISVLDRTKEPGSIGEPLYLDVLAAIKNQSKENIEVFSGRYGLSSKNTAPSQISAVYKNMSSKNAKIRFTVGINDDVTGLSLAPESEIDTVPTGTYSCKFWGTGSDGTVGSAKNTIKIIGDNTSKNVQAFFSYDSKKSGGVTVSHIRFGDKPIKSTYYIDKADFVACHTPGYIYKYDILKDLKPGGNFLLNCSWTNEELNSMLPDKVKRYLAENNINFYILDAVNLTRGIGLGGRVNTMLQAAFFKIVGILEKDQALELIKDALTASYSKKGIETVKLNHLAAEKGMQEVRKIDIPKEWKNAGITAKKAISVQNVSSDLKKYVQNILEPIIAREGNNLPVSAFEPYVDGTVPLGSAAFEKRGTASFIPHWIPENCIQCGLCSYVCPHAVIRPIAPTSLQSKKMTGIPNLNFSIVVSAKDCTGCESCVAVCPGMKKIKALEMNEASQEMQAQEAFDYAVNLPLKPEVFQKFKETTIKGSQFKKPLLEFSGACAGCGETPYAKLATQLFGDRMYIANATGCSSIWGGSFPSSPYTTKTGKAPHGKTLCLKTMPNSVTEWRLLKKPRNQEL